MLIRISLVIAILAALAAGALNFVEVKKKIETVVKQREDEKTAKVSAQDDARKTHTELDKTTKDLKQTQEKLVSAEQERNAAVITAADATKKAETLTEKLGETNKKPQEIASLNKQITDLQNKVNESVIVNKGLQKELDKKIEQLAKLTDPDYHIRLPATCEGKVLVADPKWDFVVINVGDNDDVKKDGELLVNRNGRLVAKLQVTEVQKDRSIANVMPGWRLADVMEGDKVIPAYLPE
jgi:DNA repair exonuclease SbcCD ATPase subunit